MPRSAIVARLELAYRLRAYRADSGETARAISERLSFSHNYLSALERGREVPSIDKLADIASAYDLDRTEIDELTELVETSRLIHWFDHPPYADLLTEETRTLCGLELGASSALVYESVLITGLLQAPEYAEAVIVADAQASPASIRHRKALRLKRQERLQGDDRLELTVVMNQAALMQELGGKVVLRNQLQHLADLIDRLAGSLAVHIEPFEAQEVPLVSASTVVSFSFAHRRLEPVVWREAIVPIGISGEAWLIDLLSLGLSRAIEGSLSREDSLALIRSRIVELS